MSTNSSSAKSGAKTLAAKMTRDIDIKAAQTKDLVEWYNENSGSAKPIAKFKDRATAEAKCAELRVALIELAGGTSKPDAAKKAAKAAKTAKPTPEGETGERGRKSAHAGKTIFRATEDGKNPRREGSHGFRSFEVIDPKKGTSYEDYIAKGGRNNDLGYDIQHGFVKLK